MLDFMLERILQAGKKKKAPEPLKKRPNLSHVGRGNLHSRRDRRAQAAISAGTI